MKRTFTFLAVVGFLIGFNACERQEWSHTRDFHLSEHSNHDAEGHAKSEDKDDGGHHDKENDNGKH